MDTLTVRRFWACILSHRSDAYETEAEDQLGEVSRHDTKAEAIAATNISLAQAVNAWVKIETKKIGDNAIAQAYVDSIITEDFDPRNAMGESLFVDVVEVLETSDGRIFYAPGSVVCVGTRKSKHNTYHDHVVGLT